MKAIVTDKLGGGYYVRMEIATGERVTVQRGQIPWKGPISIGQELDVDIEHVTVPRVTRIGRANTSMSTLP